MPELRNHHALESSKIGCPVRVPSVRGGRPRASRCGRPATQALAFGQRGAPTATR